MKSLAEKLAESLNAETAASAKFLAGRSVEEALDLRDDPRFDAEWMRAYETVRAAGGYEDIDEFSSLEERVFAKVYAAHGSSDLAARVSEDLGLIARAAMLGIDTPWLTGVALLYAAGQFPAGSIPLNSARLREVADGIM